MLLRWWFVGFCCCAGGIHLKIEHYQVDFLLPAPQNTWLYKFWMAIINTGLAHHIYMMRYMRHIMSIYDAYRVVVCWIWLVHGWNTMKIEQYQVWWFSIFCNADATFPPNATIAVNDWLAHTHQEQLWCLHLVTVWGKLLKIGQHQHLQL